MSFALCALSPRLEGYLWTRGRIADGPIWPHELRCVCAVFAGLGAASCTWQSTESMLPNTALRCWCPLTQHWALEAGFQPTC